MHKFTKINITFLLLTSTFLLWPFNFSLSFAQTPDTLWTRTYGGISWDDGRSVQQTSDGGYVIVGMTESFGIGGDVYFIKTDADGDTIWTKAYGGLNNDCGHSIQQTSDDGYIIVGYTYSFGAGDADLYLIKTNANGDTMCTKTYGGQYYDAGHSIQLTADSGYIVTGVTYSFGAGDGDLWLLKIKPNGDTLWTKTYGGADWDEGVSIQQTADSGYIIMGATASFGSGDGDVWLLKIDVDGDTVWTKRYGGSWGDIGMSVQQINDGGYMIAGYTHSFGVGTPNYTNVYLLRTNTIGDTMWTRVYGGIHSDEGYSVLETTDGGYIVAGHTQSFGAGPGDVWLLKTGSDGDTLWTETYGGDSADIAASIQHTAEGGYIITGYTESFGSGGKDVWLLKLAPEPGIAEDNKD
jgi:hypothetical protein